MKHRTGIVSWMCCAGVLTACASTQEVQIAVRPADARASIHVDGQLAGTFDGAPVEAEVSVEDDSATFTVKAEPDAASIYQETSESFTIPRQEGTAEVVVELQEKALVSIATEPPLPCAVHVDGRSVGAYDGRVPLEQRIAILGESATVQVSVSPVDDRSMYEGTTRVFTVQRGPGSGVLRVPLERKVAVAVELVPPLAALISFVPAGDPGGERPLGESVDGRPFQGWIGMAGDELAGTIVARPVDPAYLEERSGAVRLRRSGENRFTLILRSPPVADFETRPQPEELVGGEPAFFDASTSRDDGTIVDYRWTLIASDGTESVLGRAQGRLLEHVFDAEGRVRVRLTVTDDTRLDGTREREVFVRDDRPLAELDIFPSRILEAGDTVVFSARRSAMPARLVGAAHLTSVELDFGDGTRPVVCVQDPAHGTIELRPIPHRYREPGDYTVQLAVAGSNGRSRVVRMGLKVAASQANEDLVARAVRDLLPRLEPVADAAQGRTLVIYNLDHAETQPDDLLLSLIEEELFIWLVSGGSTVLERDKEVLARAMFDRKGTHDFATRKVIEGGPVLSKPISLRIGDFEVDGDLLGNLERVLAPILGAKPVASAEIEYGAHEKRSLRESVAVEAAGPLAIDLGTADLALGYRVEQAYVDSYAAPGESPGKAPDPDDIRDWMLRRARVRIFFRLVDLAPDGEKPFRLLWAGRVEGSETQHVVPGELRKVQLPPDGCRHPEGWLEVGAAP